MNSSKKKQAWKVFDFEHKTNKPVSKLLTNSIGTSKKPLSLLPTKSTTETFTKTKLLNFHAKLTPKQFDELAVHPKKLQELQGCLIDMVSRSRQKHPPILLLTGPSGSGKSTALKVICNDLGILIDEWINPMDQDYEITQENQLNQFIDFMVGSKWPSLFQKNKKHLTAIKDFPNVLIRQPEQFDDVLQECWYKTKTPIVFICTQTNSKSVNLINLLFPDKTIQKFTIRQIEFNPCAVTLMKNALKRAESLTKDYPDLFIPLSSTAIEAIIATSMGDIRNAVNQFYLSSLKGAGEVPLEEDKSQTSDRKRKKRKNATGKIKSMERDETLGLFHGLGRVLNPKWVENGRSERLSCDIEKLIDEFSTQPEVYTSFLFENYLKYFGSFDDAVQAAEILSFSATFLDNFVDRHQILLYGLWISVLGLMVSNRHKVSKWTQITAPVKVHKRVTSDVSLVGFDQFDIFYSNLIKNSISNVNECQKPEESIYDSDEMVIIDDDY